MIGNTRVLLSHPVSSESEPSELCLEAPDVRNVLDEAEEADHCPQQPDGLDLDVAQGREAASEAGGPGVLALEKGISEDVLRLWLDLLEAKQDEVRAGVLQEGAEVEASLWEPCGNIPGDQMEAECNEYFHLLERKK